MWARWLRSLVREHRSIPKGAGAAGQGLPQRAWRQPRPHRGAQREARGGCRRGRKGDDVRRLCKTDNVRGELSPHVITVAELNWQKIARAVKCDGHDAEIVGITDRTDIVRRDHSLILVSRFVAKTRPAFRALWQESGM